MSGSTAKKEPSLVDVIKALKDRNDISWFQKCVLLLDFKKTHDMHMTVNPFDYLDVEKVAKGLFDMIAAEANGNYEDLKGVEVL